MKILLKLLLVVLIITSWSSSVNAGSIISVGWGWSNPEINIDDCWGSCDDIQDWVDLVKNEVNSVETERAFSEYVQDVVLYLISFVSFIAIIYIIYAWFMILTWAWDEEKLKKSKTIIFYVAIWMILIWLAYPIVMFMIDFLGS